MKEIEKRSNHLTSKRLNYKLPKGEETQRKFNEEHLRKTENNQENKNRMKVKESGRKWLKWKKRRNK